MLNLLLIAVLAAEPTAVRTLRVPDSGIQPQVSVSADGTRHLLYYKGDPKAGDLYYTSAPKNDFGPGIRVNSIPGAACAIGTMRGGQIATSHDGRVHVAWNGSGAAAKHLKAHADDSPRHAGDPMLYTHSNADRSAFAPERDVMSRTRDLDGGGSVAVAPDGRITVVWHASTPESESKGEAGRQVFLVHSSDGGATFTTEAPIAWPASPLGACGCCGLKATFAQDGSLLVLFRSAAQKTQRDMHLLKTTDFGKTCTDERLGEWKVSACPMSSASAAGDMIAWETKGDVFWSSLASIKPVSPPDAEKPRKHPSVAKNDRGQVLLAWVEGSSFGGEGVLRWQAFEASGTPIENAAGGGQTVPTWSLVAAFTERDGSFTIVY